MQSQPISNSDAYMPARGMPVPALPVVRARLVAGVERIRRYQRYRSFVWIVALPMLLICLYLWAYAGDRYVSESRVAVRQAEGASSSGAGLNLLGLGGLRSMEDMHFLEQHIYSIDMLDALDERLGLRDMWMASPDWLSRLEIDASRERFLAYYRSRVHVVADATTGIITLKTEAFDPNSARQINQNILAISDQFINELSNRIAREQVAFIETELVASRQRFDSSRAQMLAYQNEHQVLDPTRQAEMKAKLAAELEMRLAELQAELNSSLSYLQPKAPSVLALKAKVRALSQQIRVEKAALSGVGRQRLNKLAADYQELTMRADFAADLYRTTLTALERARVDATMKLKSLALIVSPHLPDEPERPRRLYLMVTWLFGLLISFGLITLVRATIEDHRE